MEDLVGGGERRSGCSRIATVDSLSPKEPHQPQRLGPVDDVGLHRLRIRKAGSATSLLLGKVDKLDTEITNMLVGIIL